MKLGVPRSVYGGHFLDMQCFPSWFFEISTQPFVPVVDLDTTFVQVRPWATAGNAQTPSSAAMMPIVLMR